MAAKETNTLKPIKDIFFKTTSVYVCVYKKANIFVCSRGKAGCRCTCNALFDSGRGCVGRGHVKKAHKQYCQTTLKNRMGKI